MDLLNCAHAALAAIHRADSLRREIERLIELAVLAPSPMNRQPWASAVLLGAERLHDVRSH